MIDFYKNCCLSRLGKDAGNQSMSDYIRNISGNYEKYLLRIKEEKSKPTISRSEDYKLYL